MILAGYSTVEMPPGNLWHAITCFLLCFMTQKTYTDVKTTLQSLSLEIRLHAVSCSELFEEVAKNITLLFY